jgi:hypothetical protein
MNQVRSHEYLFRLLRNLVPGTLTTPHRNSNTPLTMPSWRRLKIS